jgi:hypothetical protein
VIREGFAARLGERFVAEPGADRESPDVEAARVELELVEVTALGSRGGPPARGRSEPFSCLFRGPADRPLDQGTYGLVHPAVGRITLFIVPVGPVEGGLGYEAIFN